MNEYRPPCNEGFGYALNGTPDWIRTGGLQSRSLTLYPTELRAHIGKFRCKAEITVYKNSGQTVVKGQKQDCLKITMCKGLRHISAKRAETSKSGALSGWAMDTDAGREETAPPPKWPSRNSRVSKTRRNRGKGK